MSLHLFRDHQHHETEAETHTGDQQQVNRSRQTDNPGHAEATQDVRQKLSRGHQPEEALALAHVEEETRDRPKLDRDEDPVHALPDHQRHRKPFTRRQQHEEVEADHDCDQEDEHALHQRKRLDPLLAFHINQSHHHRDGSSGDVNIGKEAYPVFGKELGVCGGLEKEDRRALEEGSDEE